MCKEIKVDFVNYPYAWIDDPIKTNDLILASEKDIGAMKLSAIAGRGSKKDFYDLYILLNKYFCHFMKPNIMMAIFIWF